MNLNKLYKLLVWAVLLGIAQTSFADVPAGYYSKIDGKKKVELKTSLKSIIADHYVASYSSLWNWYESTDVVPGTTNQVFDYYCEQVAYFPSPSSMNKEHACPQSWWGGGGSSNCYSDLFNVMPSNSAANSAKSNYPLGIVKGTPTYENKRMKVGSSARSQYSGKVFEPCDEYKGDFARIYFYVATCYATAAWGSKSSVAETCAFTKEDYPTIKSAFLSMLLEWHHNDPVSEWEVIRNERVYSVQKNRNPFIDYPQLADYIWGTLTDEAFDLSKAEVNGGADYGSGLGGETGTDPKPGDDPIVNPGTDPDPDKPGTDPDDPSVTPGGDPQPDVEVGTVLLDEPFDDCSTGNSTQSSGSSTGWEGNDNFPEVSVAYQAGGAVRIGSSKNSGLLTSRRLTYQGGPLAVRIRVKGWTTVEGKLTVGATGAKEKEVSYEAVMDDDFEEVTVLLDGVFANPQISIGTTSKRAIIDQVTVFVPGEPTGIFPNNHSPLDNNHSTLDILGRKVSATQSGRPYLIDNKIIYIY